MFQDIYANGIKKVLFDMLKQKYQDNELVIERIANSVNNPKDYELLTKLLVSIYESAYLKAIDEHKEIMRQRGVQVVIGKSPVDGPKIFQEK